MGSKISVLISKLQCDEELKSEQLIPSKRSPDEHISNDTMRVQKKSDALIYSDSHTITIHSSQQESELLIIEKSENSSATSPPDQ
jgi:hypothetical protein